MRGVLYIAHNNGLFDYGTMALCSALTVRYHLNNPPIALITDRPTWTQLLEKHPFAEDLFMEPIFVPEPDSTQNKRTFKVGSDGTPVRAPYHNGTRTKVFDLSPFDETLMIDTDVLVLDDRLNMVWQSQNDIMINTNIGRMLHPHKLGSFYKKMDDVTIPILWATITFFRRTDEVKNFFRLVEIVRDNFHLYGLTYRFQTDLYRNDYAYSVASHIMSGRLEDHGFVKPLPTPYLNFTWDPDTLVKVEKGKATFLINNNGNQFPVVTRETVHVMNKASFIDCTDQIIEAYNA